MTVRIITDSGSDLSTSVINELGIIVMPCMVSYDGIEFEDGVTTNSKAILDGMRDGKKYKTSQVPTQKFRQTFLSLAEKGEEAIFISFSSDLSGTYLSALMAYDKVIEKYPSFKCEIINSQCVSLGLGFVVKQAALWAKKGMPREELVRKIKSLSLNMENIFTVDDMDYLYRGGRISFTKAFIGGLLNYKPILHIENGKMIPIEKIQGRKKSIDFMVELFGRRGNLQDKDQLIAICHGDDMKAVELLKSKLSQRYGMKNFMVNIIGCAVGAHCGPGSMGLFFTNKRYQA